jgi:hypothetical protein
VCLISSTSNTGCIREEGERRGAEAKWTATWALVQAVGGDGAEAEGERDGEAGRQAEHAGGARGPGRAHASSRAVIRDLVASASASAVAPASPILFAARGWGGVSHARETGRMRWAGQGRAGEGGKGREKSFF